MMNTVERTDYVLESRCCGTQFPDGNWELECPKGDGAALIFARYAKKQLEVRDLSFQGHDQLVLAHGLDAQAIDWLFGSNDGVSVLDAGVLVGLG